MKTQPEIISAFDDAQDRLEKHDIEVQSNSSFGLFIAGKAIATTDSVDGLTAFADALDFSATRAA